MPERKVYFIIDSNILDKLHTLFTCVNNKKILYYWPLCSGTLKIISRLAVLIGPASAISLQFRI